MYPVCLRSSLFSSSLFLPAFGLHFFLIPFSLPYWFINYNSLFWVCVCMCVCVFACFRFYGIYTSLSYHIYSSNITLLHTAWNYYNSTFFFLSQTLFYVVIHFTSICYKLYYFYNFCFNQLASLQRYFKTKKTNFIYPHIYYLWCFSFPYINPHFQLRINYSFCVMDFL